MKIRGNITYKDNNKLVYINLALVALCAFLLFSYYQERNYKEIVAIDSAHEVYHGRMVRIEDKEALEGQLKAHIHLAFFYLYNMSEYTYESYIVKALHLWGYEGKNVVADYEKDGLFDLLQSTPTRTECIVKSVEITGEKETENLQYPEVFKNEEGNLAFVNEVKNNVRTYLATVKTYHRIIRGSQILSEEIHIEKVEVYTGFGIDSDNNPFGMKVETIEREVQIIKE